MFAILMPYKRQIFSVLVALLFSGVDLLAINRDSIDYSDRVFAQNLKTVRLHPSDWEAGYPVLDINSENILLLNFDQIESAPEDYYYTIIHCTYDWKPSSLMFFEYAEGFEENEIKDYEDSQSTFVPYSHHKLEIPNQDLSITKSGNYLIVVYIKSGQDEKIVLTRRFMVYEQLAEVTGRINPGFETDYRSSFQKLDFTVSRKGLELYDPQNELKPVVMQNFQWNTAISDFPFSFIDNDNIVYEWDDKVLFNACNEFRYFNFNNLELNSERVEQISFTKPYYNVKLMNDKPEMFSPYRSVEDINGSYIIRTNRFANNDFPEIQSEYAIVKFSLEYNVPLGNSEIHLYGDLSGYELNESTTMLYNLETRCYEKLLFLKQGYYNYRYILVDNESGKKPDHSFFEGSHKQTNNDYLLFLYYREPGGNYDRLVNFSVFNSANN
jgi:hypothetical protein